MPISRRDLFKLFGACGVNVALGDAWANGPVPDPHRRYLFLYFGGGWDQTLCFDARDPAAFPDAQRNRTGIELAWSRLPPQFSRQLQRPSGSNIEFGPAVGTLAGHFRRMCVVRGMTMETLTHQVGYRYFLTGKQPSGQNARGSSPGALVVDQLAAARASALMPIPNLVLDTEAYYEGTRPEARAFRGGTNNSYALTAAFLRRITPFAPTYGDIVLDHLSSAPNLLASYRGQPLCDGEGLDARGVRRGVREAQARSERMFASSVSTQFDLRHPAAARYAPAPGNPGAAAFIARQALLLDVSNCVTVRMQNELDTHGSNHSATHAVRLFDAFERTALLLSELETTQHPAGGTYADHVTVVMFSEFTRTPLLNPAGGRDHSLTNCCVLWGAGVRPNTVIGASSDTGMQPQPVHRDTGRVVAASDPSALLLRPEHVLGAVLQRGGYDISDLRVSVPPCLTA